MRRFLALLLVVLLVAVAFEEYRFGIGREYAADLLEGAAQPEPPAEPAAVPPPPGLSLLPAAPPLAVAEPVSATAVPRPKAVRSSLVRGLTDDDLGPRVFAGVDALDGTRVFRSGRGAFVPASTTKILTATAALSLLGPDHTFTTRAVAPAGSAAESEDGAGNGAGRIVLVGGGDPYLRAKPDQDSTGQDGADVRTLARSTAAALAGQGVDRVTVRYDDSLFTGGVGSRGWRADYLAEEIVSPITALMIDGGRAPGGDGRVANPSARTAQVFARELGRAGVEVRGRVRAGTAPAGAREVAAVQSRPLAWSVERLLEISDNEAAEVIGHHVGLATSGVGSFDAGAAGVLTTLDNLGVRTEQARLFDGSGLSRRNRVRTETLLDALGEAASPARPDLRPVITGLPVAGFTGSLTYRFAETPVAGRGTVRAKTGTLTGVSALAGVATDTDGTTMLFVFAADRVAPVDTLDAREALDALAGSLGACACG